jgi:hypothetical protein
MQLLLSKETSKESKEKKYVIRSWRAVDLKIEGV